MRIFTFLLTIAATIPFTQASYRVRGQILQYTNTSAYTTIYVPSIYLEKDGVVTCDGHNTGEEWNIYNESFIPGGVPTNSSFSGPWGAADCPQYTQVEVFGIGGQVLVRDHEVAFWLTPELLAWQQLWTSQYLAGIDHSVVESAWSFDSGNVH